MNLNTEDLEKFKNAYVTIGKILGKLEVEAAPPAQITPANFLPPRQEPVFKLVYDRNQPELAEHFKNREVIAQTETVSDISEGDIMTRLKKRKDGRYQSYVKFEGKRYYVYSTNERECIRKKTDLKRSLQTKTYNTSPRILTFHQLAILFMEQYKKFQLEEETYRSYVRNINNHLKIEIPMRNLKLEDVQHAINVLPATAIKDTVFQITRQICNFAYAHDYIKKDFAKLLTKGKTETSERDALLPCEQKLLLENLIKGDVFSERVLFFLLTGARPCENKCVEEITPGWIHIHGTKTKKSNRWIKISEEATNIFIDKPSNFFIFDNKRFRQRLQHFAKNCGIDANITVYTLRHTFATNLYYLGATDKERAIYMGHSTTKVTNDNYTMWDPNIDEKDIRQLYGNLYPHFKS
jgi:integrase